MTLGESVQPAVDVKLNTAVERARQLDPSAFEFLVDKYSARLHGFMHRFCGSREDAQDLVQEVFVRVVRNIVDYDHTGRFEAWLFRIASNLARDRARRLGRAPAVSSLGASEGDGERVAEPEADEGHEYPSLCVARKEDMDAVEAAILRLPAVEREVVMLRHYSDMSFEEIAVLMGTPLGTALARAHRGLGKLRKWLGDEDEGERTGGQ